MSMPRVPSIRSARGVPIRVTTRLRTSHGRRTPWERSDHRAGHDVDDSSCSHLKKPISRVGEHRRPGRGPGHAPHLTVSASPSRIRITTSRPGPSSDEVVPAPGPCSIVTRSPYSESVSKRRRPTFVVSRPVERIYTRPPPMRSAPRPPSASSSPGPPNTRRYRRPPQLVVAPAPAENVVAIEAAQGVAALGPDEVSSPGVPTVDATREVRLPTRVEIGPRTTRTAPAASEFRSIRASPPQRHPHQRRRCYG